MIDQDSMNCHNEDRNRLNHRRDRIDGCLPLERIERYLEWDHTMCSFLENTEEYARLTCFPRSSLIDNRFLQSRFEIYLIRRLRFIRFIRFVVISPIDFRRQPSGPGMTQG